MPNSCENCPSRVKKDEVKTWLKGFATEEEFEVCATYGHILSHPQQNEDAVTRVHIEFGKDCDSHSLDRPDERPKKIIAQVAIPDPATIMKMPNDPEVDGCSKCVNFLHAWDTHKHFGVTMGMCMAQGRLLGSKRLTREATDPHGNGVPCQWRSAKEPGQAVEVPVGLQLMPRYSNDALGAAFIAGSVLDGVSMVDFIEPTTYVTDFPVSEHEAKEFGIRAWREVKSKGDGIKTSRLPIFERSTFSEEEQAKIPSTGDDEHPEHHQDHDDTAFNFAVIVWEKDLTPILIGPAGTGKTEAMRHMAWLMQCPFDRLSITGSTEVDDLFGKFLFENNETVWKDGRLPQRWVQRGLILIDEPNMGPQDVWDALRPLTDNSKQLVLDAGKGKVIERNPMAFLAMAMNGADDTRNIGAKQLADADGSRLISIAFDLPPLEVEMGIIARACTLDDYLITPETLDLIMKIAADIRAASDGGNLSVTWGVRPNVAVARMTEFFPLLTAYKRALLDRLDSESSKMIAEIISSYIDTSVTV